MDVPNFDEENAERKEEKMDREKDYANAGSMPVGDLWNADVKYSDQLANGNLDDDRELEDEDDPNDDIVDDNGFTNQFVREDDDRLREWNAIETSDQVSAPAEKKDVKGVTMLPQVRIQYHDELANGDNADDKQLVDINDQNDDDVDENGYVLLNEASEGRWARFQQKMTRPAENNMVQIDESRQGKGFASPTSSWGNIMAQVDSKRAIDSLY